LITLNFKFIEFMYMFFIFKLGTTLNAYLRIIKNNSYTFCKALKIHCFLCINVDFSE